jgi:hypothetical protein
MACIEGKYSLQVLYQSNKPRISYDSLFKEPKLNDIVVNDFIELKYMMLG